MAEGTFLNIFPPRGEPPLSADMSKLSCRSNPCAEVCLQAREHETPHIPTFSSQDSSGQGGQMGSKTTKQY